MESGARVRGGELSVQDRGEDSAAEQSDKGQAGRACRTFVAAVDLIWVADVPEPYVEPISRPETGPSSAIGQG